MLTFSVPYILAFATVWLVLTVNVIRHRMRKSPDNLLNRTIRGQANFVETVPMFLVLLLVADVQNAPALVVHVAAVAVLLGRVLHGVAFAMTSEQALQIPSPMPLRQLGMILTLTGYVALLLALVWHTGYGPL